jgi:HSP20 family protein
MRTLKPVYPFENAFPAMLKGIVPPLFWDDNLPPTIRLDVEENEKAYTIRADIPGVKKEDIFVDVEGPVVTIRAEVRRETPEKKEPGMLLTERFCGSLARTFTLPMDVEADTTTARYENGVLWLTLPKTMGSAGHRITVN